MKEINNIIICGIGAIGTIYATKLYDCPFVNLKILVDEKRKTFYENNPTFFNNKQYRFDFITPTDSSFSADLIIFATKNNGFIQSIENAKNFIKDNTIAISLLNGIKSEEVLKDDYKLKNVLYSYYIGHTSTRIKRNITHDGVYQTVFGEKDNTTLSDNVKKLKALFDKAKINYEIPTDMDYSRWWKFLVNVGYNQASAILNASYGDFQKSNKTNHFAIKLMEETVEIAKAEGVKNTEKLIPEVLKVIEKMLPDTRTSMLQDVDAKRETEVDIFAGHIIELGKKHNIKTPYNQIAFEIIKAIDEKNTL